MGIVGGLFAIVIILIAVGLLWSYISPAIETAKINAKIAQTDTLEKQEALKKTILPKVGDQVCELQFTVGGYFEYAAKDLLKIPTPTTAYISGSSVGYKWVNCVQFGGTQLEWIALSLAPLPNLDSLLSILPVSGTGVMQIELVGQDGTFLSPKNYPSLEKTITVDNVQTPIQFAKTFYVTKLPRQDYTANIVFDGGSINEQPLGAPYVYKIMK